MYFDLDKQKAQTAYQVIANLLKQAAWPPEKDHPRLKPLFESIGSWDDDTKPSQEELLTLFIQYVQSRNFRVLFDALDECDDRRVYDVINRLRESNIGVYITTRSHLSGELKERYPNSVIIDDFTADPADIKNFLETRIKQANKRELVDPHFTKEIIDAIIRDAKGLYHFSLCIDR